MIEGISLASPILNVSILKLGPTRLIISSMCGVNVSCQSGAEQPGSGVELDGFCSNHDGWSVPDVFGVSGHTRARLLPRGQIIEVVLLAIE